MAAALLALAGCAAGGGPSSDTAPVSDDALLVEHGLDGLTGKEIVDRLDRLTGIERPADIRASIRVDELLVSDGESEVSVPLPTDEFYLAIAPFVDTTHECFYHSLTTCQGELVEVPLDVLVTTSDGEVLVDEQVTTFGNGFTGMWLPREITGTIELSYDGRTATYPFATDAEAPTCVTDVRLT